MAQVPDQPIRSSFLRRSSKTLTDRLFHQTTRQRTLHQPVSQSVSQSVRSRAANLVHPKLLHRPLPSTLHQVCRLCTLQSGRPPCTHPSAAPCSVVASPLRAYWQKTTQMKTTPPGPRSENCGVVFVVILRTPFLVHTTRRPARETHSPAASSPPHCPSASVLWRVARLCRCRRSCFGGSAT
jgi:hypothetical protein